MPEIQVNGTVLHYAESGPPHAPALVLGHSLFFDHTMFDPLTALLDDGLRVIRYCHRGQGHSARDEPYDMGGAEGKLEEFDPLVDAMAQQGVAPLVDVTLHIMFGDTSLAQRPELVEPWKARMAALGPEIAGPARAVVHRTAVLDELASTNVPILAIAGAEDHAYSVEDSRAIADAAPRGRLETVEAAGHSVSLEQPEAVASLLRAHIGAAVAG